MQVLDRYAVRIAEFRKAAGYTQAAFARELGIARETLSRIENDRIYLTEAMEHRIAVKLGLSDEERPLCFGYPGWTPHTNRSDRAPGLRLLGPADTECEDGC